MSRQATEWVLSHLPEIRNTPYPDPDQPGKLRALGGDGLALIMHLANITNKDGTIFQTVTTLAEESGVTPRVVTRLLGGFELLGWITRTGREISYQGRGRPTPEYALTLVPKVRPTTDQMSHRTVEKTTKPNNEKEKGEKVETEPEPQPDPKPKPANGSNSETGTGVQGGREWTDDHEQLLEQCLYYEPKDRDKGKLVEYLRREYEPIVRHALKERPDPDLVSWCIENRRNKWKPKQEYLASSPRELAPWEKANPDCPNCDGAGMILSPNENGTTENKLCDCTKEPHLRAV